MHALKCYVGTQVRTNERTTARNLYNVSKTFFQVGTKSDNNDDCLILRLQLQIHFSFLNITFIFSHQQLVACSSNQSRLEKNVETTSTKNDQKIFQPRLPLGVQNAAQNVKFLCFMRLPNRRGHERQTIFQRPFPIRERATITKLNEKEFSYRVLTKK